MKTTELMALIDTTSDADLVAACLAGNRDAFGRIVERYQRLLCSLAYSAVGSVTESEDLAQEAFVTAWRRLGTLREPEKLRSWLCTILRHQVGRARRTDRKEPVRGAESLEAAAEIHGADPATPDTAMRNEEQTILWHALRELPEAYREPLVLYYREHRSVEHVAGELDLSEDTVKQRLSRGRKMLKEHALAFVEGALERSTPGRLFTVGVLAALPAMAPTAKAAGLAAGATVAAKSGWLAKATPIAALLAAVSGFVSTGLALRANLDQSRTQRERRAAVVMAASLLGGFVGLLLSLYFLRSGAVRWPESRVGFAVASQSLIAVFAVAWPWLVVRLLRSQRRLRTAERIRHPEKFADPADRPDSLLGNYRSRSSLLGLPLVHIRFATPDEGQPPVVAWIAGGDRAVGLLFAWGAWAIAPVSVGAVSVGIFSLGAVSLGLISLGSVAIGGIALGSVACGIKAWAWISALGWDSAQSQGFAIARHAAEGVVALARHANDAVARQWLENPHATRDWMLFCIVASLLAIGPVAAYARAVRRRFGKRNHPAA